MLRRVGRARSMAGLAAAALAVLLAGDRTAAAHGPSLSHPAPHRDTSLAVECDSAQRFHADDLLRPTIDLTSSAPEIRAFHRFLQGPLDSSILTKDDLGRSWREIRTHADRALFLSAERDGAGYRSYVFARLHGAWRWYNSGGCSPVRTLPGEGVGRLWSATVSRTSDSLLLVTAEPEECGADGDHPHFFVDYTPSSVLVAVAYAHPRPLNPGEGYLCTLDRSPVYALHLPAAVAGRPVLDEGFLVPRPVPRATDRRHAGTVDVTTVGHLPPR